MALGRRWCVAALLLAVSFIAATADPEHGLTVFWGRNRDEGSLAEACDTGIYNTVIISFYSVFGHGRYWGDLSGHPLNDIGADIVRCQQKEVVVLLSIGGGGKDYSLPTAQSAVDVADNLWNAHLGGSRRGVFRPFGDDVAVDGIDFFIDQGGAPDHYDELARLLSTYKTRQYDHVRLTATPRCVFPDRRIERIHVRFYGDDRCSYPHVHKDGVMAQWNKWSTRYPRSWIYLGLPAANEPGRNDVVGVMSLKYDLMPGVKQAPNYGGVMLWDRYHDKLTGYGRAIYNAGVI